MNKKLGIILTYGIAMIIELIIMISFPIILSKHWIGPIGILIGIIVSYSIIGLSIIIFSIVGFVKTLHKDCEEA